MLKSPLRKKKYSKSKSLEYTLTVPDHSFTNISTIPWPMSYASGENMFSL